jgi:hypothetical protein
MPNSSVQLSRGNILAQICPAGTSRVDGYTVPNVGGFVSSITVTNVTGSDAVATVTIDWDGLGHDDKEAIVHQTVTALGPGLDVPVGVLFPAKKVGTVIRLQSSVGAALAFTIYGS